MQTGRRNLTKSQLVKAYSAIEEQLRKEAKERQSAGGGDKKSAKAKSVAANLPQAISEKRNPETTTAVAQKMGVSRKTYEGMRTIVNEGSAEQIERMDKGGKWSMVISSRTMRHGRQKYNEKQREKGYLLATFLLALDKKHEKSRLIIGRKTLAK